MTNRREQWIATHKGVVVENRLGHTLELDISNQLRAAMACADADSEDLRMTLKRVMGALVDAGESVTTYDDGNVLVRGIESLARKAQANATPVDKKNI